jgi:hypothetical protein
MAFMAASQKLSNARNVDSLEIYKVLHLSSYSFRNQCRQSNQNYLKNAARQELSNALYIILVACTVDLLEIYKVLHSSPYSSETNADRATKIIQKMQYAKSYRTHSTSSL